MTARTITTLGIALAFGLTGLTGLTGCGDNANPPQSERTSKDLGPAHEGVTPDRTVQPDLRPDLQLSPCEKKCTDKNLSQCVTDPKDSTKCVECLQDSHCTGNLGAFGPKCDTATTFCICTTDADCANNHRGNKCNVAQQMCSCSVDSDCKAPFTVCSAGSCKPPCKVNSDCPSSTPTCDTATGKCYQCKIDADCAKNTTNKFCLASAGKCVACKADPDCANSTAGKFCLASTGQCVKCKTDSECTAPLPFCDQTAGSCKECKSAADCANSQNGSLCTAMACTCAADTDCKGAYPWGGKCVTLDPGPPAVKHCGCGADAECAGNPNGPTCYVKYNKCSCKQDSQCTSSTYAKCTLPYDSAEYAHCEKPCAGDAECKARMAGSFPAGLVKCSGSRCVACADDADCASSAEGALCSTAVGKCVQCKADSDCKEPSSPVCHAWGYCGTCKDNSGCADAQFGGLCDIGSCTCYADDDCKGSRVFGSSCLSSTSGSLCGCQKAADCTNSTHGPTCDSQSGVCTCAKDADCTKAPYSKCTVVLPGSKVLHCAKPCATAADCSASSGFRVCDTTSGECLGCKTSADCANWTWSKTCEPTAHECLECLTNAECTVNALGPKCDAKGFFCYCTADADCATNVNGHKCSTTSYQICGCAADTDCPSPKKCTGSFQGDKYCK